MLEGYVYTIAAVEARLRRGRKTVWLFWPNTGQLKLVMKSNLEKVKQQWRKEFSSR